jgi:GT2 family glycosyltransferase
MNIHGEAGQPLVSIITLNYNKAIVTLALLESTKNLLYKNFEILICDMASSENPASVLNLRLYPKARLLYSSKNLGFAGGNNWGMRMAKGEFIFIVNNDTELTPDIIEQLLLPFNSNPGIGVVCPKIRYFEDRRLIQYAGFKKMNPYTGRTSTVGEGEVDSGQHDMPGTTNGAHGCAMMIKKAILEKTGMFPEKFFLYYEEWDWSIRIQNAGYQIWYQPSATIYHKESMTVGRENPIKVYYHTRNRILFMRRNSDIFHLVIFSLFFTFFALPKSIFTFLKNGRFTELKYFIKGIAYNMTHSSFSTV